MKKLEEVLGVSVNQILDMDEKEDNIALKRRKLVKKLKIVIPIIIFIIFLGAIYPRWTEIWYAFGQNLYYLTH